MGVEKQRVSLLNARGVRVVSVMISSGDGDANDAKHKVPPQENFQGRPRLRCHVVNLQVSKSW